MIVSRSPLAAGAEVSPSDDGDDGGSAGVEGVELPPHAVIRPTAMTTTKINITILFMIFLLFTKRF